MTAQRIARYGTALVLVHLLVNMVHGAAHRALHIGLDTEEKLFVAVVIIAGPLVAMALLWTTRQHAGLILLALAMAGSLLFGVYHHFVAMGPDHVAAQPPGAWGITFVATSCLLALIEVYGAYAGVRWLFRPSATA